MLTPDEIDAAYECQPRSRTRCAAHRSTVVQNDFALLLAAEICNASLGKQGVRMIGFAMYVFEKDVEEQELVTRLRIDSQVFFLSETEDVPELKRRIETAAQNKAKFVEFMTIGHGRVSVLVTAVIGVRFEETEHSHAEVDQMELDPPTIDFVYDYDYDYDYE